MARTTIITYNGWATNDTGFHLTDVHTLREDADALELDFSVVVRHDTTEATMLGYVSSMQSALEAENQRVTVAINGTNSHDLTGVLADVSGSAPGCAQFVRADAQLLPSHRSSLSRAYRVSIRADKPATQTGKVAKRTQRIGLATDADGVKTLSVEIEFTPKADGTDARAMYADGTDGFDARVTAIKAALSVGTTDEAPVELVSDEDDRTLTARAVYTELPFAESDAGTNDPSLVGVSYSTKAVRRAGSGAQLPGLENAQPLAEILVSFSAGVKYSGSELDLDSVIAGTVLPYVSSKLAPRLQADSTAQVMGHTLTVQDLPRPRVSGDVLFLVAEGGLLAASVITLEQRRRGVTYPSVLDGEELSVDEHKGPGLHLAQVTIVTEELGTENPALEQAIGEVKRDFASREFVQLGDDLQSEGNVQAFDSPYDGGEQILTSTGQAVLYFRKVKIRNSPTASGGASGGVGSTVGGRG